MGLIVVAVLSQAIFGPMCGTDCELGQRYCAGVRIGETGCAGVAFWAGHVDCF